MTSLFALLAVVFSLSTYATESLPSDSIYNLKAAWQDQNGKSVSLADLRGEPTFITMAYTGCKHTCPLTVAKLKEIEKLANAKGLKKFRIALASFDPKGDKPARLKEYAKEKNLTENRWILLSPSSDANVRALSAALGISYTKEGDSDFAHSNVIALLDAQGHVLYQLNGLGSDIEPLIAKLEAGAK